MGPETRSLAAQQPPRRVAGVLLRRGVAPGVTRGVIRGVTQRVAHGVARAAVWAAAGAAAVALLCGRARAEDPPAPVPAPAPTAPAPTPAPAAPGAAAGVADAGLTEFQDVRRVQIDVSVIDPRGDELASIPGLPREAFELRIDHRPLPPELAQRVEFDEICPAGEPGPSPGAGSAPAGADPLLADDRPTILVFADLNFLDARMRHAVAKAIADLGALAAKRPVRVKVIAYAQRIISLTPEFTSDPAEIARAGRALTDIAAIGPPMGARNEAWRAPAQQGSRTVPLEQPELPDLGDQPEDPERAKSAFEVTVPGFATLDESGQPRFTRSLSQRLADREVDARPSLAAIEAVLLSHGTLRGRKALVLFTSSWFDLPDEMWLQELRGIRRAAQGGFTIWPVDARGLTGGPRAFSSRLLGFLAAGTGGEFARSAGRLELVFSRALAQLSCYYLFSVPLPQPAAGERDVAIDVRLDTRAHPEYWYYRVRSASDVTLLDRQKERERLRLAALMEPAAHRFPEVRVSATYPAVSAASPAASATSAAGSDTSPGASAASPGPSATSPGASAPAPASTAAPSATPVSVVEVGTVLSDLTFSREVGGLSARLALEGAVVDETGRTVCLLGDGTEKTIRTEVPPARFPPSLLVLRSLCPIRSPGRYEVRAIVEDLVSGDVGAAISTLEVAAVGPALRRLSGVRLGRSSGRDFLLDVGPRGAGAPAAPAGVSASTAGAPAGPGAPNGAAAPSGNASAVVRDDGRRAFVPLADGEPVAAEDRVRLRFVACGAWTPAVFLRGSGAGPGAAPDPLPVPAAPLGERRTDGAACREYEAVVEEGTLRLGAWRLEIRDPAATRAGRPAPPLSSTQFRVVPREPAPPPEPGQRT